MVIQNSESIELYFFETSVPEEEEAVSLNTIIGLDERELYGWGKTGSEGELPSIDPECELFGIQGAEMHSGTEGSTCNIAKK